MFGRVLGHFTILFWGFGTKMNEHDEKEGELKIMEFRVWGLGFRF